LLLSLIVLSLYLLEIGFFLSDKVWLYT
jgi:hypothetical protein